MFDFDFEDLDDVGDVGCHEAVRPPPLAVLPKQGDELECADVVKPFTDTLASKDPLPVPLKLAEDLGSLVDPSLVPLEPADDFDSLDEVDPSPVPLEPADDFDSLDKVDPSPELPKQNEVQNVILNMSVADLYSEFASLNLPTFGVRSEGGLKNRLTQWVAWNALSDAELHNECLKLGAFIDEVALRPDNDHAHRELLLVTLIAHAWCLPAARKLGLPLQHVTDVTQILSLAHELEYYQSSTRDILLSEYTHLGLPEEPGLPDEELLRRLRLLLIWDSLPISALRRECEDRGIPDLCAQEEKHALLQLLLTNMIPNLCSLVDVPVDRFPSPEAATEVARHVSFIQSMSAEQLQECCKEWMILLPDRSPREDYLYCLQCAISWHFFSISELEKECKKLHIRTDTFTTCTDDERRELFLTYLLCSFSGAPVERFETPEAAYKVGQQFLAIAEMTDVELKQQCEEWELPIDGKLPKEERRKRMYMAALWWELPFEELKRECEKIRVKADAIGSDEEKCWTLIARLFLVLCWETFEGLIDGIEHLDGLPAAARLRQECRRIQGADRMKVKSEYESLGLQSQGVAHEDLVDRLKHIFLWAELPLPTLQKFCRDWGCNTIARSSSELAAQLARYWWNDCSWQHWEQVRQQRFQPSARLHKPSNIPTRSPNRNQAPRPEPKNRVGAVGKNASDLAALGLPHSAGKEDVKRAFRQLALKHHPDKNPHGAKAFVAINGAYSSLMKHFKG